MPDVVHQLAGWEASKRAQRGSLSSETPHLPFLCPTQPPLHPDPDGPSVGMKQVIPDTMILALEEGGKQDSCCFAFFLLEKESV